MPRIYLNSPRRWISRPDGAVLSNLQITCPGNRNERRLLQWLVFGLLLLVCGLANAQTYKDGKQAYLDKDYDKALTILKPLAEQGNSDAQVMLGLMYDYGNGVDRDPVKAVEWYTKAAEQGVPVVQHDLGVKYFQGKGIDQDYEEAAHWWGQAANAGLADSQFNLGLMYYRGLGIKQNYTKAIDLFQRAANQDHANAQYSLAVMYAFGQGIDKNYSKALKLFRAAAEQNIAQAQYNLGVFYENGYGVEKDLAQARNWYAKAAAQDVAKASERLQTLKDRGVSEAPAEATTDDPGMAASTQVSDAAPQATASTTETDLERDAWVRQQAADDYTLQLISLTDEKGVRDYLRDHDLDDHGGYITVTVKDVRRYNAIYGHYATYDEAEAAIDGLPEKIRQGRPWIRNFGILHEIMQ